LPLYAVAPLTTFDLRTPAGDEVEVEERPEAEVTDFAPVGTRAWNPAFDVTPASLVAAIVTEQGVLRPPYEPALAALRISPAA
jgi:methylthioribose-1-phosphate isomerase